MKRSLTILSLVLFSFIFIGGTASADDGMLLSSDANPTFGTAIATALDCSMPSTQAKTTAKIEKWSESRMTRYNQSWQRKLRDLVYRNYSHQYTRVQVNDMSETELADLLSNNPHMVDTIHNMRGRCAKKKSSSRTASSKPAAPAVNAEANSSYPTADVLWAYAAEANSYQERLEAFSLQKTKKEELAKAEEAKRLAAERLVKAESDVSEESTAGRTDALAKAKEADTYATELLRQA